MEPFTITWAGAAAILGSVIAITVGILRLFTIYRAETQANKNNANASSVTPETIQKDVAKLKKDYDKLLHDVVELQAKIDNKVDTQIDSVKSQVADVKDNITRLQNNLEKLTDIIIKNLSDKD